MLKCAFLITEITQQIGMRNVKKTNLLLKHRGCMCAVTVRWHSDLFSCSEREHGLHWAARWATCSLGTVGYSFLINKFSYRLGFLGIINLNLWQKYLWKVQPIYYYCSFRLHLLGQWAFNYFLYISYFFNFRERGKERRERRRERKSYGRG